MIQIDSHSPVTRKYRHSVPALFDLPFKAQAEFPPQMVHFVLQRPPAPSHFAWMVSLERSAGGPIDRPLEITSSQHLVSERTARSGCMRCLRFAMFIECVASLLIRLRLVIYL